ncbi:hypothetical protein QNM96_06015 [Halostagnicola sp. A-GB9-2]|nr:hypothetical protein [Halostagnicola sp. A-GB9-2]MDJ1431608.1 hypothetical protein [Halostagnicola sp. A-GB9-2]
MWVGLSGAATAHDDENNDVNDDRDEDDPEVDEQPESIRELVRAVDRHPPEVLDNVNEPAEY